MKELEDGQVLLTHQDLYDKVWTTAMRKLGPELGLSEVGLRKICAKLDIPTPPAGHRKRRQPFPGHGVGW